MTQTELGRRLGCGQGTISKYEAGIAPISEGDLLEISRVLEYPAQFFQQSAPIEGPGLSELFHRKRQSLSANILHQVYALAEIRRLEVLKLLRSSENQDWVFPQFPIDEYEDNPEKIARTIRALWQIPAGPIFNVTRTIERANGIVYEIDFGTKKIDGFSHRSRNLPPLFYLNKDVPPDRWRWTLAHELGHIVMHFDPQQSPKETEEQADRFAGEFLAPAHELKPQLLGLDFQKLAGLKRYWKISMAALVMRAYHIGAITDRQRRTMFVRLSKAGYRLREPVETDPPIETPEAPHRLAQYHIHQLGYSEEELQYLLAIGYKDYETFYRTPHTFTLN